jgi:hypothetical protein
MLTTIKQTLKDAYLGKNFFATLVEHGEAEEISGIVVNVSTNDLDYWYTLEIMTDTGENIYFNAGIETPFEIF